MEKSSKDDSAEGSEEGGQSRAPVEPAKPTEGGPAAASLASGVIAAPARNGHAVVLSRLAGLAMRDAPHGGRARSVRVSFDDELLLRDTDDHQVGARGAALARSGSTEDWRAFLATHFRQRYALILVFDAKSTG